MKASVLDLRYRTRDILRAIDRNEEVPLYYRGKQKAVIVPVPKAMRRKWSVKIPGVGMWKDMIEPVADMVSRLRKGRSF